MSERTPPDCEQLIAHIAALEAELARYAAKYGLTDETRRLLTKPQNIMPENR